LTKKNISYGKHKPTFSLKDKIVKIIVITNNFNTNIHFLNSSDFSKMDEKNMKICLKVMFDFQKLKGKATSFITKVGSKL